MFIRISPEIFIRVQLTSICYLRLNILQLQPCTYYCSLYNLSSELSLINQLPFVFIPPYCISLLTTDPPHNTDICGWLQYWLQQVPPRYSTCIVYCFFHFLQLLIHLVLDTQSYEFIAQCFGFYPPCFLNYFWSSIISIKV